MKRALLILTVTVLALVGSSTLASAGGYYRSRSCSRYSYYPHRAYPVYVQRAVPYYYRPVVVVQPYWHQHYYGGRYMRCHYYGGTHHYGYAQRVYPPASGFHIGISIFR